MRTRIGGRIIENNNAEDALMNIKGVSQVLSHFSLNGGIDVCEGNSDMFSMLSAVLEDAYSTLTQDTGEPSSDNEGAMASES